MTELDWVYSLNSKIPQGKSLPAGVKRYAAVVSYDGSAFCGFQKQKHSPSVQQELEQALSSVANSEIVVSCAGRTDTAVHASYQVVHFDTPVLRTGRNWVKGSNSQLPDSVALLWADEVTESFHARFSATSRTYRYVIRAAPARPAILSQGVTWVHNPLNTAAMQEACQYLLGEQDFSAFRGAGCQSLSPNRNITSAKIIQTGELIVFEVTANAFVLHMVRNIIGSLMEVGFGRRDPGWIGQLIKGRDRTKSAATASPKGLYLVNVGYPSDSVIPLMPKGPLFLNI